MRGNRFFKLLDRYAGIPLVWLLGLFAGKNAVIPDPASILVIKLSALGDTVLLVPAIRALRKKYPKARITALGTDINAAILKACPYVDEIIVIDIRKLMKEPWSLCTIFGSKRFDIACDFDQWLRLSPLLSYVSGAPVRVGFNTCGQYRHFLYTHPVKHSPDRHEVECFLELLRPLGIEGADSELEFKVNEEALERAKEALKAAGIAEGEEFIVLHPETPQHGRQRQWPGDRYITLGKELASRPGKKVVVTGTKEEAASNREIAVAIGTNALALPALPVDVFAGVLLRARLLICGNTGIMHLACAIGTPVVALHGPTSPVKWGPRGKGCVTIASALPCSPCLYLGFEYGCGTNRCMESITVEEVLRHTRVAFSS